MIPLAWWPAPVAAGTDVRTRQRRDVVAAGGQQCPQPSADGGEQQVVHGGTERVARAPQLVERFPDDGQPARRPDLPRQRRLGRAGAQVGRGVAELPRQAAEPAEPGAGERPGAAQRRGQPAQAVADQLGVRRERRCRRNRRVRRRRVRGRVEQGPGQGDAGEPVGGDVVDDDDQREPLPRQAAARPRPATTAGPAGGAGRSGRPPRSTRSAPAGRVAPSMCRLRVERRVRRPHRHPLAEPRPDHPPAKGLDPAGPRDELTPDPR